MTRRVVSKALRKKLGKLIPLLGSDRVGERAGAAAAIKRLLAAEGFDLHDLADNVGRVAEPPTDLSIQASEETGSRQWTLDDFLVQEELDFQNLIDHILARPGPSSNSVAAASEPVASAPATLDEVLAELDETLNPERR
jgi:hypothetical protein